LEGDGEEHEFFTPTIGKFYKNVNIWWASNYKGGTFGVLILWAQEWIEVYCRHVGPT
jgi:hypothetical protein